MILEIQNDLTFATILVSIVIGVGITTIGALIKRWIKMSDDRHIIEWEKQEKFRIESRRNLIIIDTKVDAGHYAMNGAIDKIKFNEFYDRKIRENTLKFPELFEK